jgi:arginyl-tRNA synthetase
LSRFTLYEEVRARLEEAVRKAVAAAFDREAPAFSLERPPDPALGDYATTVAFDLARSLRRAPRSIAAEVAARLERPPEIREVRVEGSGYLNFFLDRGSLVRRFFQSGEDFRAAGAPETAGKTIVEHTNINPNKAAHIGHLRNAVLGDTLVRCLRASGLSVEVQNYIDDTGVQVADVVVGFVDLEQLTLDGVRAMLERFSRGEAVERNGRSYRCIGDYCWDLYAEVGRAYESRPETKGLRAETLHAMEERGNLRAAVAEAVAAAVVAEHVATMGRLGVSYDLLPRESDILGNHFWSRAFGLLKERDTVVLETEGRHAGCWVMKLSATEEFAGLDEPDKILVRSNGTVTYTGKDIAYQLWKFGKLGLDFRYRPYAPDWSAGRGGAEAVPPEIRSHTIWQTATGGGDPSPAFGGASRVYNVIDVRQSYPQKVVREGLQLLGFRDEAERSIHFAYEMVALTPRTVRRLAELYGDEYRLSEEDEHKAFVEMSGRKGQGVKAHDLYETMVEQASRQVREREPGLPEEAVHSRARSIAVGALRYFMVKFGRNKIIAFDFDEAMSFEGDTGPYLQYSAVRADNIFRKLEEKGIASEIGAEAMDRLAGSAWEDDLWELFAESIRISEVVRRAVESLEIASIARHAFALSQAFSRFYHRHPIASEADPALRERRLAAARAFRSSIGALLALLGIPAPEKM